MKDISTTRFMREYMNPGTPIVEPLRITKFGEPYCDVHPVTDEVVAQITLGPNEVQNVYKPKEVEVPEEFHSTHSGQCALCQNFSHLMSSMVRIENNQVVARLVCRECWVGRGIGVKRDFNSSVDMVNDKKAYNFN